MRKVLVVLVALAGLARAEPLAPKRGGTLDRLADELAGKTASAGSFDGATDVAVTVRIQGQRSFLADTIEALLIARLAERPGVRSAGAPTADQRADIRREGWEYWLQVDLVVDSAQLMALGRLWAPNNVWAQAARTVPGVGVMESAPFAAAAIDAEVRAYLLDGAQPIQTPPTTRPVKPPKGELRPRRLSFDAPAPLLGLAAADLDGDGRVELIALTADEVLVVGLGADGAKLRARASLEGPAPVPRPREPVGALLIADLDRDGRPEVLARTTAHASGAAFAWRSGALIRAAEVKDFPVCVRDGHVITSRLGTGVSDYVREATVAPGLPALPDRFLGLACAGRAVGVLDGGGALRVFAGQPAPLATLPGVGTAFALAELEGGQLEVAASAYRAPGDGDELTVRMLMPDGTNKVIYRGPGLRGGITALAIGDLDGDGTVEVALAIRLPGSARTDLWLLD